MKKLSKLAVGLSLALTGSALTGAVSAGTAFTTLPVTATVVDSCTVSATSLTFGSYSGLSGLVTDAAATISPTCTNGTVYSIALDAGLGSGASSTSRFLTGPSATLLAYNIYDDVSRSSVWMDGTGTTTMSSAIGNGAAQPVSVYARIPASQNTLVGSYADTVTVTLTY